MRAMKAGWVIVAAILPLAACAGLSVRLPPTAIIRSQTAAIEIGRARCLKQGLPSPKGHWWADYDDGVWAVLFERPQSRGLGPGYEIQVSALDGRPGDCSIIVPGD